MANGEVKQEIDPMIAAIYGEDYQTAGIPFDGEEEGDGNDDNDSEDDNSEGSEGDSSDDNSEGTDGETGDAGAGDNSADDNDDNSGSEGDQTDNSGDDSQQQQEGEDKTLPPAEVKPWDADFTPEAKALLAQLAAGDDKAVFNLLKQKYGHEELSPEEKIIEYYTAKHPYLDAEEILFKLAQDYGVGATEIAEEDLTPELSAELRRQAIERKRLLSEADGYFTELASSVEIPALPSLADTDADYRQYLSDKTALEAQKLADQAEAQRIADEDAATIIEVKTIAQGIDKVELNVKVGLDQGEFDLKTDFVLNDKMKKQLADYAIEYTPTQGELKAHTTNGKFDMAGYVNTLAHRIFAPQIQKALLKEAISKDRENFTEKELKNSSFRNNEGGAQSGFAVDPFIRAMQQ